MTLHEQTLEAKPHTAVYRMHKYFARRPWNVFSDLIAQYSSEGEIVLDPFCGGGVTIVEALKLRRKAVGVDVNPVATYVTSKEVSPVSISDVTSAFDELRTRASEELAPLYSTRCRKCGSDAVADWLEWDEKSKRLLRVKLDCPNCGSIEKRADRTDQRLAGRIDNGFAKLAKQRKLWYPPTKIPRGDKTDSLLAQNLKAFHELFTRRNLLALAILRKEILQSTDPEARDLLSFVLSSSLKWASRQSHLRGRIVEGWAMHAYWIYPKSLEMNVWNVFQRRFLAVRRGKQYSNEHIGEYCKFTNDFAAIANKDATCLLLNRDAADLPIPNESIDAVITDPPYGGNVNYGELADFWYVWMNNAETINKENEAIINRTQEKTIDEYQHLLGRVFRECYRVLKPGRHCVSTFNSKDFRVVTSFLVAALQAGFTLSPGGVRYQPPIRSYTTTFHAMQIGAFVGDFVFVFEKGPFPAQVGFDESESRNIEAKISQIVDEKVKSGQLEPNLREQAYRLLIPFLAKYALTNPSECRRTADFFERRVRENDNYFKGTRRRVIARRRRMFSKQ